MQGPASSRRANFGIAPAGQHVQSWAVIKSDINERVRTRLLARGSEFFLMISISQRGQA